MLAFLGFTAQYFATGKDPVQNLLVRLLLSRCLYVHTVSVNTQFGVFVCLLVSTGNRQQQRSSPLQIAVSNIKAHWV